MKPREEVKRYFRRNRPVKKVPKLKVSYVIPHDEEPDYSQASALTRYLMENESSGLSRRELTEQFHEYDCEGELVPSIGIAVCTDCDYWERIDNGAE